MIGHNARVRDNIRINADGGGAVEGGGAAVEEKSGEYTSCASVRARIVPSGLLSGLVSSFAFFVAGALFYGRASRRPLAPLTREARVLSIRLM